MISFDNVVFSVVDEVSIGWRESRMVLIVFF